jgi:SCP-2 sterol transfer family
VIVSASRPPARGLMVGTDRRDYPLLRGAIVKLAHDDPATAARLLTALLPAQGVAVGGPLAYDVTIKEAGTFGVAIAGGRASVERLDAPQARSVADFHLIGDAVTIAEVLAGVNHRIGRFFGPIRARGRKRKLRDLRPITAGTISLADAARAGARLDPELVYRTLSYAVHPSWTRGHDFTIAQEIEGEPPETWYLTVRDGAGVTAASTAPREPDATVTMARDVFDRLLRGENVPAGRRPCVKGDLDVVDTMRAWTDRARGDLR